MQPRPAIGDDARCARAQGRAPVVDDVDGTEVGGQGVGGETASQVAATLIGVVQLAGGSQRPRSTCQPRNLRRLGYTGLMGPRPACGPDDGVCRRPDHRLMSG